MPAHTYMATATAVLAVGAIPVIVDIDETITIESRRDPRRHRAAYARRSFRCICGARPATWTRSWRSPNERGLLVLEDVCQGIGGSYEGRKLGSIGHAGAFSFNFFKNMSGGEGGGIATSDPKVAERARCSIDPCHFYWQGRNDDTKPFAGVGARASELMGAMLNVQLDRLDGMIEAMRAEKKTDPGRHEASRQSRPDAVADEQRRPRLRDAGDVPAAERGGGAGVRQDDARA